MSKSTLKILTAITAACVTHSVFSAAITDHQMVITENSSSSWSATFDGAPLSISVAPDFAEISMPTESSSGTLAFNWSEPGSTIFFNVGIFNSGNPSIFEVSSDVLPFPRTIIEPDGFTFVGAFTNASDGVPVDLTLHDKGDAATAPDTGTTGSLLGLSLTGLAFFRRKLC